MLKVCHFCNHLFPYSLLIDCDHAVTKKVAIIGSGIGGSSAAYFLKEKSKQFSDKVKFDITGNRHSLQYHFLMILVFERDSIVGGRTRYYEPEGIATELIQHLIQ